MPASAYRLPFHTYPNIEINGSNTLSFNVNEIAGSQTSFRDDNYGEDQTFTHTSSLFLTGELYKDLYFTAQASANPYMPNRFTWNTRYDGNDAKVMLGEFTVNLPGNEFVGVSRLLKGIQVDTGVKSAKLTFINSELETPVRTDTFYGRNSNGPFYLTVTPIVNGSEIVLLNGVPQERVKDYTLDYVSGILTFDPSMIVSSSDRVVVSYEAAIDGVGGGKLYAVRASYPVNERLTVGVNHLELQGRGVGASQRSARDQFLGNNDLGPYYLTYRPVVPGSETVKFNGLLQERDVVYTLDYTTGRLQFKAGYAPDQRTSVIVDYQVSIPGSDGSSRTVSGVDLQWYPLRGLSMKLQAARSGGESVSMKAAEQILNEPHVVTAGVPPTLQSFTLKHTPIRAGSDSVRALTRQLVRDVEYTLDYTTGALRLLVDDIPISATGATLFVTYTTAPTTVQADGDAALALSAEYARRGIRSSIGFRQVDGGFTPLERVGYRNTRRALEWSASYQPIDAVTLAIGGDDTRLPYNPYSTSSGVLMEEQNRRYEVQYRRPNWPTFALRRTTRSSSQLGDNVFGDDSSVDSLIVTWSRMPFSANFSLNHSAYDRRSPKNTTDPYAPVPDDPQPGDPVYRLQGSTDSANLGVRYQPNERLDVSVNLAQNRTDQDGDHQPARDSSSLAADASYRLTDALTLYANWQSRASDSTVNASGSAVPGQESQYLSLRANWQAWANMNVDFQYATDRASGGDYANTDSRMFSTNIAWQPRDRLSLHGYWTHQLLTYLDGVGDSTNNMLGLGSEIGLGKLSLSLDAQRIWGDNSFSDAAISKLDARGVTRQQALTGPMVTGNELLRFYARLTYPIAQRQDLFISGEETRNTGYPSESLKHVFSLGWNYHFSHGLTFTLDASRLLYYDYAYENLNYQANRLNARLSWNF